MCVDECVYTCVDFSCAHIVKRFFAYTRSIRRYKVSFTLISRALNINVVTFRISFFFLCKIRNFCFSFFFFCFFKFLRFSFATIQASFLLITFLLVFFYLMINNFFYLMIYLVLSEKSLCRIII